MTNMPAVAPKREAEVIADKCAVCFRRVVKIDGQNFSPAACDHFPNHDSVQD